MMVLLAQMCLPATANGLPYSLSCATISKNKATPCGATNTGSGSNANEGELFMGADTQSYHTPVCLQPHSGGAR